MKRHGFTVGVLLALVALSLPALAQSTGPDVIVGDLPSVQNYADVGIYDAFAVGTTSCNIGDANLLWIANSNQHPVIAQNMFRLNNGRFEQIGLSWLKHGFTALTGSLCDPCSGPGGSILSPGCSDPYSAGLNGSQTRLGPRFEVNAATGFFPWPYSNPAGTTGNDIFKRIQVRKTDLALGGQFFVDGHYIAADDTAAGNDDNNASWRAVNVTVAGSGYNASTTGPTFREEPAIFAWQNADPSVQIAIVDVPNDGRFYVGLKTSPAAGGLTTYEYAVQNFNSDRSGGSFTIPVGGGATVTNIGFHDVEYHSGEPWDNIDWTSSFSGGDVVWQVAPGSNNALRWSTLYNFRFDSDTPPGDPILGLFTPGTPANVVVNIGPAAFEFSFPNGQPNEVVESTSEDIDFTISDLTSTHDAATVDCLASVNGAPFASVPVANLGGGNYRATLPGVNAGDVIDYYFSADETGGGSTLTSPALAPGNFFSVTAIPQPVVITPGTVHVDDFEGGPGSWTPTNGVWEHGAPTASNINSASSGSNVFATNLAGDYGNGQNGSIEAAFDCTALSVDPVFSMNLWFDTEAAWDGVNVQIDTGSGFQTLGSVADAGWYNDADVDGIGNNVNGWSGDNNGYVTYSHALDGAAGNIVDVRITFGSDGSVVDGNGAAVDDVIVSAPAPSNGHPSTPGFGTLDINGSALNGQAGGVQSGGNGIYNATVSVGSPLVIEIGGEPNGQPSVLFIGRTLEGGVPILPFGVVDLDPANASLPLGIVANGLANPPAPLDFIMFTDSVGNITIGAQATTIMMALSPIGLSAINVTPNNGGITITNTVEITINP